MPTLNAKSPEIVPVVAGRPPVRVWARLAATTKPRQRASDDRAEPRGIAVLCWRTFMTTMGKLWIHG